MSGFRCVSKSVIEVFDSLSKDEENKVEEEAALMERICSRTLEMNFDESSSAVVREIIGVSEVAGAGRSVVFDLELRAFEASS